MNALDSSESGGSPHSGPYRDRTGPRSPRRGVLSDRRDCLAHLAAIAVVGMLPYLAWLLGRPVDGWELGLGTFAVLSAATALVGELVAESRS